VESRSAERNRLLKLLETAKHQVGERGPRCFGVSGRLMLQALVQATATTQQMADLAKGLLRKKIPELKLLFFLEGKFEEHHRFLLGVQLRRLRQWKKIFAFSSSASKRSLSPMPCSSPYCRKSQVWIGL